jgi:predicted ester cyclase
MPNVKYEDIVRQYYEKATEGDVAAIEELLHPNFVLYSPISNEPIRGIEGFKAMIAEYKGATPFKVHVDEITEDGDTSVVRWRAPFKHTGQLWGTPPTGKQGEISGSDRIKISEGKIIEVRNNVDLAAALQQMGLSLGTLPSGPGLTGDL